MRFEMTTTVKSYIMSFWVIIPYSQADGYQLFGRTSIFSIGVVKTVQAPVLRGYLYPQPRPVRSGSTNSWLSSDVIDKDY
jgi:hypothetical protein